MKAKYDADGLPIWEKEEDERDLWVHDDPIQMGFGLDCQLSGFSLPGFDMWLSALPSCVAKTQLLKRRADAFDALKSNNEDAEKRHLEFMLLRMQAIQRDEVLLPLARIGKPMSKARSDGGRNKPTPEWHEACLHAARLMLASGKKPKDLPSILVDRFSYDRSTIDRLLIKAGIKEKSASTK